MQQQIDYVVPMVFPADVEWQRDLRRVSDLCDADSVRYRSWGTEELLIQCVSKYMPWLRSIIILLARSSQVQPWMTKLVDGTPKVRIVLHAEFMPKECLPTFNSRAMEMFLHRIPDISDCFIYGNDDMFPLSPLAENDFFADGVPCQHMQSKPFPKNPNNFHIAGRHGLNFVAEEFGLHFTDTWLKGGHSLSPILKSSCLHLWQRSAKRIMESVTPFRMPHNFNQYIYSWYQHFSGQYVDTVPKSQLVKDHTDTPQQMVAAILDPENQIVCINDYPDCHNYRLYADMAADAINRRLHND